MNRLTAKLMNRLTAKLVDRLTAKLVDRLTAKLVVVNLVKLHLTKFKAPTCPNKTELHQPQNRYILSITKPIASVNMIGLLNRDYQPLYLCSTAYRKQLRQ